MKPSYEELREKLEAAEVKAMKFSDQCAEANERWSKEKQRAEAAEARIKASQEQEPFKFCDTATGRVHDYAYDCEGNAKAVYLEPVIPPELAELQRENAELRKLLESKVPECWQLVPATATRAMQEAAAKLQADRYPEPPSFGDFYIAMLSAAPQPPKEPKP